MAAILGNTFINDLLKLIFNNVSMANYGDAAGILKSAADGSLYVSLHTADPGAAGNQTTSETVYAGYLRVAVARSTAGWTVTNQSVSPFAAIAFPPGTVGAGDVVTYAAVGRASSGTGAIIARCALTISQTT